MKNLTVEMTKLWALSFFFFNLWINDRLIQRLKFVDIVQVCNEGQMLTSYVKRGSYNKKCSNGNFMHITFLGDVKRLHFCLQFVLGN